MKNFLIALLALALVPATVNAGGGGGGGKANAKIKVTNNGTDRLGVILDKTAAQIAAIFAHADPAAEFGRQGGKFVDAGGNVTFSGLKTGAHTVSVAFLGAAGAPGAISNVTVQSKSGGTHNIRATGSAAGGAPALSVQ